jgi:hypothetical protein
MKSWLLAGTLSALCLLARAPIASAADDATMFRVFLKDGTSLVSYGEAARVGDRVVFSMPIGAGPNAPLHLVNLASERVDWHRTDAYAVSARANHYAATRAESDYAALSGQIAKALDDVLQASDVTGRLSIVEQARKSLVEWPEKHYNYRAAEVHQMVGMLDEAIASLRAAAGVERFSLDLVTFSTPPAPTEPLLPSLTPRDAIEQTLAAARVSDSSAERVSLLAAALESLDREKAALDEEWVSATKTAAQAVIAADLRIDRSYQALSERMMYLAEERAKQADVRGVEQVIALVHQQDVALGRVRPEAVEGLVAAVQDKLDAARRLRLARDRWELRQPIYRRYRAAIRQPMDIFTELRPSLEDIKSLAGSSPTTLAGIEQRVARIVALAAAIPPPEEFSGAHALFVSAAQLAQSAAQIRRESTLANNIARAWDASSAAAGALMLDARARAEMLAVLRLPQLR